VPSSSDRAQSAPVRPLRIAHIVTIYRGVVGILEAKLLALDAYDDLEVTALTAPKPDYPPLPDPRVRHLSFPLVRPIRPWTDLRSTWALYRILRRERFDVVHTHSAKAGMVGALAAWLARVPLSVHTYHGLPFFDGQPKWPYRVFRCLEWLACRLRHHVFSQNRRDMPACVELMGSAERVSYEGNGVNTADVRAAAEREARRAQEDFPPGRVKLVMISRLEPVKRVGDFLRACERLQRDGVDFAAVIAGYGPLRPRLEAEIVERGLAARVRLLGWAAHAAALLAAADVVVLTSEKEGIPRSLIEAMALGRPVVATNVLGTQELVEDGGTGWLVPLGDTVALAEKIKQLAADAGLRQRFGEAGRRRVEEHFNDLKIAAALREFYRGRVRARGRG